MGDSADSNVGDECREKLLSGEASEFKREHRSFRRLRKLLVATLFILVLSLTALFVIGLRTAHSSFVNTTGPSDGFSVPRVPVKFDLDDRFAGPSSVENDQAWNALIPQGGGFVRLSKQETRELAVGQPLESGDFLYDVSLFHQLHCLASIRSHVLLLQGTIGRNDSAELQRYLLDPQTGHVYHCFDYIRQSLMCAGDMTLEWPRDEADGRRFAFDGWGVTHQCKDWPAILRFIEEHSPVSAVKA